MTVTVDFEHNFGTDDDPFVVEVKAEFSGGDYNGFLAYHKGECIPDEFMPLKTSETIDELCLEQGKEEGEYRPGPHPSLSDDERNPGLAGPWRG